MNTPLIVLIVLAALALAAALFVVGLSNKLVGLRNRFKDAYAQNDVHLKRRYAPDSESGRNRDGLSQSDLIGLMEVSSRE